MIKLNHEARTVCREFAQTALQHPEPNMSRDDLARSVVELRKEVGQLRLAMEQQGRLSF
jgi:hypothetical protein